MLIQHHVTLCECVIAGDDKAAAEETCRQAMRLAEQSVGPSPDSPEVKSQLARCYAALGGLLTTVLSREAEAKEGLTKAVEIYEQLVKESPTRIADQHQLAHALVALAGPPNQRVTPDALQLQQRAVACFESSAKSDPENRTYRKCLAVGHNDLAWFLATCSDERLRDPGLAVQHAQIAVQLNGEEASLWNTLGAAYYRVGQYSEAIGVLEKSMKLGSGGSSFDWFFLAMARGKLGELEAARHCHDEGVRGMEKNRPEDHELLRFRTEAAKLLGIGEPDQDPT